jgi:hypothetical protein
MADKTYGWDPYGNHVQPDVKPHQAISSRSILIMIPRDDNNKMVMQTKDATQFMPVGLVQDLNMAQNKNLEQIYEIGSAKSYFLPGMTVKAISLRRVMFGGANLLKLFAGDPELNVNLEAYRKAGADNSDFFINLASPLFDRPLALVLLFGECSTILEDAAGATTTIGSSGFGVQSFTKTYGAVALENAYLGSHNLSITGGQVLISESVEVRFDSVLPIQIMQG